jgi:hypothetical protein
MCRPSLKPLPSTIQVLSELRGTTTSSPGCQDAPVQPCTFGAQTRSPLNLGNTGSISRFRSGSLNTLHKSCVKPKALQIMSLELSSATTSSSSFSNVTEEEEETGNAEWRFCVTPPRTHTYEADLEPPPPPLPRRKLIHISASTETLNLPFLPFV